LLECLLR